MLFRKEFENAAESYFKECISQVLSLPYCTERVIETARSQFFEVKDEQYVRECLQDMYSGFELAMTLRG